MIGLKRRFRYSPSAANVTLAVWIFADALRLLLFSHLTASGLISATSAIVLMLTAIFVLARPLPMQRDLSSVSIVAAVATIIWPLSFLVMGPSETALSVPAALIQTCVLAFMFSATILLGTNFSILPQYREIIATGPYLLVRHPLYVSYLFFDGALVFEQGTVAFLLLWVVEAMLLAWRAEREERFLMNCTDDYIQYIKRVRYRFIPFVY